MNHKGELSLSIIVMAALAIIVLLVMTFIFVRGANTGQDGILSCASKQGTCETGGKNAKCPGDDQSRSSWTCPKSGTDVPDICCVKNDELFGIKLGE